MHFIICATFIFYTSHQLLFFQFLITHPWTQHMKVNGIEFYTVTQTSLARRQLGKVSQLKAKFLLTLPGCVNPAYCCCVCVCIYINVYALCRNNFGNRGGGGRQQMMGTSSLLKYIYIYLNPRITNGCFLQKENKKQREKRTKNYINNTCSSQIATQLLINF